MRSGCVLDLALRLLLLWATADMHHLAATWINDLIKLVSSATVSRASIDEGQPLFALCHVCVSSLWCVTVCLLVMT